MIKFLLATFAALHSLSASADTFSFAAVKDAGVSADDVANANYGYTDKTFLATTGLASANGIGNEARAQTLPGVNRIFVSNTIAVTDEDIRQTGIGGPFAAAFSAWTDDFVITGGVGIGIARISVNVTGHFGMGYGSSGGYGLWLSTPDEMRREVDDFLKVDPTTWLLDTLADAEDGGEVLILSYMANVLKPGHADPGLSLPGGSAFGGLLTHEIQFTYGQPFSLGSVLFGWANDFGSLSAMNSAHFGFSVLDNAGAHVTTASGTVYAAAVPEPQAVAMWLLGLGGLALCGRRRRAAAAP